MNRNCPDDFVEYMEYRNMLLDKVRNNADNDDEPVCSCVHCLSLRILRSDDGDYCDNCGSFHIQETSFDKWKRMYFKRYNTNFLKTK